jgi:hypothetical protein
VRRSKRWPMPRSPKGTTLTEALLYGVDLFGEPIRPKASGPVAERFGFPPFSILDARSGDWQERKRAWAAMGIKGGSSARVARAALKAIGEE